MRQAVPLINVIRQNTVFLYHNRRCFHVLSLILNKGTKLSDKMKGVLHIFFYVNRASGVRLALPRVLRLLDVLTATITE